MRRVWILAAGLLLYACHSPMSTQPSKHATSLTAAGKAVARATAAPAVAPAAAQTTAQDPAPAPTIFVPSASPSPTPTPSPTAPPALGTTVVSSGGSGGYGGYGGGTTAYPTATPNTSNGSLTLTLGGAIANSWVSGPPLQHPRAGLGAITMNNALLAIEGENRPSQETMAANGTWQLNVSFDLATPTINTNPALAVANGRSAFALTSDATSAIVVGGYNGFVSGDVVRYDATGIVGFPAVLATPVRAPAATVASGQLFVAGGVGTNGTVQSLVQVADLQTAATRTAAAMPTGVAGAASVTLNGKLYVLGGYTLDVNGNPVGQSLVQVFDPLRGSWTTSSQGGGPAALPAARHSAAAAVLNGKIYLTGGIAANGVLLNDMQVYDPTANQWTSGPAMPTPRALLALGAFNGHLWAVGGFGAAKVPMTTVEVFQP